MERAFEVLQRARRVGYVLSGGSARCAFQIGAIEALAELGIEPALTIGVSAGAWNAAVVSAGIRTRLRFYWRSFLRMPHIDLRNLFVEHSPWRFAEMHRRNFRRFIGPDRFHQPDALPLLISVTRLSDKTNVIFDAREFDNPIDLLLASNFLFPFYMHPPLLHGVRYGDGGMSDNAPYERAFAEGCDAVVLVAQKGQSEGGLFKNFWDLEHDIPDGYRDRVIVIRPRHRLPIAFTERRWSVLEPLARVGYLRVREVLVGEQHPETFIRAPGEAPSAKFTRVVQGVRHARAIIARQT